MNILLLLITITVSFIIVRAGAIVFGNFSFFFHERQLAHRHDARKECHQKYEIEGFEVDRIYG